MQGGLDIFVAQQSSVEQWTALGNIGTQFNTPTDEVYFVPLNGCTEGYFASDMSHSDAKGKDDIYYWTREPESIDATIVVVDATNDNKPLPFSTLVINPAVGKQEGGIDYGHVLEEIFGTGDGPLVLKSQTITTDENGETTIRVLKNSSFAINASKEGYRPEDRNPTTDELRAQPKYIIPLEREYATLTICVVKNECDSDNPCSEDSYSSDGFIPSASIEIKNLRTGEVVALSSNSDGKAATQIDCNDDYEITVIKEPYYPNKVTLTNYQGDCSDGKVEKCVPLKEPEYVLLEPIFLILMSLISAKKMQFLPWITLLPL